MEKRGGQAVDVTALVGALPPCLFGAHVGGCAVRRLAGHMLDVDSGQCTAPVEHQHFAELAEHDVVGLDVLVDEAAVVCVGERIADLEQYPHASVKCPELLRRLVSLACRPNRVAECRAGDVLHGEVQLTPCPLTDVVDRHDIGVFEHCGHACFVQEAGAHTLATAPAAAAEELDRDGASEAPVGHCVHPAGGAGAHLAHDVEPSLAGRNTTGGEVREDF